MSKKMNLTMSTRLEELSAKAGAKDEGKSNRLNRSLRESHPDLAAEWDYEKNEKTPDEHIMGKEICWWICSKCGLSWQATLRDRTGNINGCPACRRNATYVGRNDLATLYPELAIQWDYEHNEKAPQDYRPKSQAVVSWQCNEGHIWQQRIAQRTTSFDRTGEIKCPECFRANAIDMHRSTKKRQKLPLSISNPELLQEWDYEHNEISPQDYHPTKTLVWWICPECNQSYQMTIEKKKLNSKCIYCYGRTAIAGISDLATLCPEVASQWDWEKNDITPQQVKLHSGKKVWWICNDCGSSWEAPVASRYVSFTRKGRVSCPYCENLRIAKGINDFATQHPELVALWDYERNEGRPEDYKQSSSELCYWKCPNGHQWQQTIESLRDYSECPHCHPKTRIQIDIPGSVTQYIYPAKSGESFGDLYPELVPSWHPTKNGSLTPYMIRPTSKVMLWWVCDFGHEWQASAGNRSHNKGCPICSHQIFQSGINDFATINPEAASLWDYEKNDDLPSDYSATSTVKKYWICPSGHSWKASICHVNRGHGCLTCYRSNKTSFPEQALTFYVEKVFPSDTLPQEPIDKYMVDILLKTRNIIIEYDGTRWHDRERTQESDQKRESFLIDSGYTMYHLKEDKQLKSVITDKANRIVRYNPNRSYAWLDEAIRQMLLLLDVCKTDIDVDVSRDTPQIMARYKAHFPLHSLASVYPEVAKYWDNERNKPLASDMISPHNIRTVYWKCPDCGHEWQRSVQNQVKAKHQCPECSGWNATHPTRYL